jgi:hypothetical protein
MDNWTYYVAALIAIIVAVLIIKKVASCLSRAMVLFVLLALVALGYCYLHVVVTP